MSGTYQTDNLRGGAWMLFAVVTASAMSLSVREMSLTVDSRAILLWRALVTTVVIVALLGLPWFRRRMRFSRPWMHVARGLLITASTHLGFYTIANLQLATATVLFFTTPIFATILASLVHGERVGPRRWLAVLIGFGGALVILRPGIEAVQLPMIFALISSLLFAMALTMSRGLAEADGPVSTFVSSVVITLVASLPIALPVFTGPTTGSGWMALVVLVVAGAARSVGDIQAYRIGEASVMGVIAYLRLVIIGLAAYAIYGEIADAPTVIGGAIIISATLYIARREAQLRRSRFGPKAGPAD